MQKEDGLNATMIHLQFKENADLKEIETIFVCEDYGKCFSFTMLTISKFKISSAVFLGERNGILVFCYQNSSDLLREKIVVVIEKNFGNLRLKAENLQQF